MARLQLRTKFLISMLVISAGLTCTTLFFVHHLVRAHVRKEIFADLHNSITTFQNFQRDRELTLAHSAELLADLPILRALMTTKHEPTIQDASRSLWHLAGSDLFVLADRSGKVVALHSKTPGLGRDSAEEFLREGVDPSEESGHWWFGAHQLYEVFVMPIYFGEASDNRLLGFLAVGHEIDDRVLQEVSGIAAGHVAFRYADSIVRSTLPPGQETGLLRRIHGLTPRSAAIPSEIELGRERFLATSVELAPGRAPVSLIVLKSYDQATQFLNDLNRLLLGLGLVAVVGGSALVFLISHTFTRPLRALVSGVRALGEGNFSYPLEVAGHDEVAELTAAFDEMRRTLQKNRQDLLDAERLATIGRMASSISHDLRHSLAAIFANAEFLSESNLTVGQREELYQEIRIAVDRMTDLLDSLLELSWTREALRPSFADLRDSVDRAVQAIRTHPEFHQVHISVSCNGNSVGWFDPKKLERVFYNLLRNACEVVQGESGRVEVELLTNSAGVEIRVSDNGPGIPDPIRHRLFEPFVSYGKENGSGMGLAVAQKIIQDHAGEISVERTSEAGTVFRLSIPLALPSRDASPNAGQKVYARRAGDAKPASLS
jgi:signal transduction histidine kinase